MGSGRSGPQGLILSLAPPLEHHPSVRLIEVNGALEEAALERWQAILRGAISDGASGIAVDLRGCDSIDPPCLDALEQAADTLRDGGGNAGVILVLFPGSKLARRLGPEIGDGLPAYDTAAAAVAALGESSGDGTP